MSTPITVSCTFDSATRKKDKSVRLVFTTNAEITTPDYMQMDERVQHTGWLVWADNEIQVADIPDVPADEANGKMSDSQYQRWILKKTYEHMHTDVLWPDWYHQQEAIINGRLLERLQELDSRNN